MKTNKGFLKNIFIFVLLTLALCSCSSKEGYQVGETYYGFTLLEKRFVEEINADGLLFIHEKSGARLLKIAADDTNKMFSVSFKTPPESDSGTPHIMEHSVLNGSKNFPVKSPFDVLRQGSLNTYLNAMTGSDITAYPVASMNDTDYFNLMNVYLDAVFNPLIYDEPRIFMQEGWHYALNDKDDDIIFNGVVYNEMKGAFSSPERELSYRINRNLFPDNPYGFSAGGYPAKIPELTYEQFLDFHRKYYHPSNSYILLYGDADLDRELEFIDHHYLSGYEMSDKKVEIPLQQPFDAMKDVEKTYAVSEGAPAEGQTFLAMSYVAGQSTDRVLSLALEILAEALVNHESSPLRIALEKAGIGRDVRASFLEGRQNAFRITVRNANPEDRKLFRETVENTFKKVREEGFDRSVIEGILNRIEFSMREGNTAQKGLMYLFMAYQTWFFDDDPFAGLEFNGPLNEVKRAVETGLLEETIEKYLIDNPHSLLLVMKPEPGLHGRMEVQTAGELEAFKTGLSENRIEDLIRETEKLIEFQEMQDTSEALASIPMLELSDISRDAEWFGVEEKSEAGLSVLHHEKFTGDIVYTKLYFDMHALPVELIPYASLLGAVLGKLNTENYSFGELENVLNIHTGGFSTGTGFFLKDRSDDKLMPRFVVSSKAMDEKTGKMFELADEILNRSNFNDRERLGDLIRRLKASLDSVVRNEGFNLALNRLFSYFTNRGMYNEFDNGLEYYWFISDLYNNFDEKAEETMAKLAETASLLFTEANLIATVTCGENDYQAFAAGLKNLILPEGTGKRHEWHFNFEIKNEGLLSASGVQYVVAGYDFKQLDYEYDGKMRVLRQILSTDWLQNQVRVIGGAYGAFSDFSPRGGVFFGSYRDPNLGETLDTFRRTPEYLNNFQANEAAMTRFIIGTVSSLDRPGTPSQQGDLAVQYYFENISANDLKAEREAVLSTTAEDIRGMSSMVQDILSRNVICVYGNEGKILENQDLFGNIIKLER